MPIKPFCCSYDRPIAWIGFLCLVLWAAWGGPASGQQQIPQARLAQATRDLASVDHFTVKGYTAVSDTDTTTQDGDTTRIRLGRSEMTVTGNNHKSFNFEWDKEPEEEDEHEERPNLRVNLFRLDLGINSWLHDNSFNLPKGLEDLELEQGKSIHVGLHFFPTRFNLYNHQFHLFTSLALDIPNYRIDRDVVFTANSDTVLLQRTGVNFRRNKLAMTYLKVPLTIGYSADPQEPNRSFRLRAGGYGALLLTARNKQVSEEAGKVKRKDRFNLNRFQYGLTARVGFRFLEFYCNYALNPIFAPNEGPEQLTAIQMGLRIIKI